MTLMRAMVIREFGEPDILALADIARPEPGPGEVLVEIAYAGVNPADWKARRGWLSQYFNYRFPFVLGFDGAGSVAATGDGVSHVSVGDRVVIATNQGMGQNGSYAAFAIAAAERTVKLPDAVSFDRAACLPTAGMTALEALFDVGGLQPGQQVLVHGGAGGTGGFAIALASRLGARVITTCRTQNDGYVRALGAERSIDYRNTRVGDTVRAWAPNGLDLVVDAVGQGTLVDAVDWVRPGGTIAAIGTLIADEPPHDAVRAAERSIRIVPTISSFAHQGRQLRQLVEHCAAGHFDLVEITAKPLEAVAQAHRQVEDGHVRGKIVLAINPAL
jgi:NADPH:quinone reductase